MHPARAPRSTPTPSPAPAPVLQYASSSSPFGSRSPTSKFLAVARIYGTAIPWQAPPRRTRGRCNQGGGSGRRFGGICGRSRRGAGLGKFGNGGESGCKRCRSMVSTDNANDVRCGTSLSGGRRLAGVGGGGFQFSERRGGDHVRHG